MPKLEDLEFKTKSKKFKKVQYRPWEISEQQPSKEELPPPPEKNTTGDPHEIELSEAAVAPNVEGNFNLEHERNLRSLHGVQKGIVLLLSNSINHSDAEYSYTKPFSIQDIANHIRTSRASIAASLLRLKQKGFVLSHETKPGRGGFASYKINSSLAQYIQINLPPK